MKLQITIPSPSPDLPEEVYNIDCPFGKAANRVAKKMFKYEILSSFIKHAQTYSENIEAKYIN